MNNKRKSYLFRSRDLLDCEVEQENKCKDVLEQVKSKVSNSVFKEIEYVLNAEQDYTYNFLLTDKPKGQHQKEDLRKLKGYWVDQTTNGGYSGDEFAGTISIKIGENEYFQFSYSM